MSRRTGNQTHASAGLITSGDTHPKWNFLFLSMLRIQRLREAAIRGRGPPDMPYAASSKPELAAYGTD